MRVWLLQRSEPTPSDRGGTQRLLRTGMLADNLVKLGDEVLWWTSTFNHYERKHRYDKSYEEKIKEKYSILYLKGCGYNKNKSLKRIRENYLIAKEFSILANQQPIKPDIIVASIPTAELAMEGVAFAKMNNIPVVVDIRDLWPDFIVESVPLILKPIVYCALYPLRKKTRWVFKNADAIIGLTNEFIEWAVAMADRKKTNDDRMFPMGYMPSQLSKSDESIGSRFWRNQLLSKVDGWLNVIFIGTLSQSFDMCPVIDAAKILKQLNAPIRFILCGNGPQFNMLKTATESLGNVIMPGWINDIQIRTLLMFSHIGLAPYVASKNYINNLPNKPGEYLSGGLSIATSLSSGPIFDVINKFNCGFSYDNKAAKLADKLIDYMKHNDLTKPNKNALNAYNSCFDGRLIYPGLVEYLHEIAQA